jgi:immune inhibitor A
VAGGFTGAGVPATASAADAPPGEASPSSPADGYVNYVAPRVDSQVSAESRLTRSGRTVTSQGGDTDAVAEAKAFDRKHPQGNPRAARQLAADEQRAVRTGKNPATFKSAPDTQEAKLLTLLVEFDEDAQDDFSDTRVPETVFESRDCVPGDVQSGPLHNNIPNPADASHEDNNSFWVDDFSSAHFDRMLYTDEGITERVRPDLTGPDGKPGVDISGYTMKNMYEEMSKGAYTVTGEASPWIEVPHSEAWYGADRCYQDENGDWVAGPPQTMVGHPDNPKGAGQLAIDAVDELAQQDPDFPWSDYDVEDQGDVDGDGNLHEPDGVVDHLVLVHAGEDKSGGGGAQGTYAIWAHSSAIPAGYEIPGTAGLKVSNYIVQPEDSGVGVFAHEYGHDLGLPDLYDTASGGDSDVDFWDLMASGSHSGPIFQSMPTHMGLWDKWVLGWADPTVLGPGDDPQAVRVGQTSRTPKGSADGVRVDLPNKEVTLATPHSGEEMWWSGNDQDWADVRLSRSVDVPDTGDAKFWMWNDYVIESDWDYGFVEVSTDGGSTWTEQKVYDESGAEVTTGDSYGDPNGRLGDFGGKQYGLTGSTDGWAHQYVDLSGFGGQTVQVRLRYATDAAFKERGWFSDDFSVTGGGETVWSDDVEGGENGWTTQVASWVGGPLGDGWTVDTGSSSKEQYYLAEWRNYDGFDEGLKYAYDTVYSRDGAWKVDKIPYNAPGLLVWYRDTSYGEANHVLNNLTAGPSGGAKGGLLVVDSHDDPLRRTGEAAEVDTSTLKNLPSRPQSSNAAFTTHATYPFTECLEGEEPFSEYCTEFDAMPGVRTFTDAEGWAPGLESRADGYYWRDQDASTVVPSAGNAPYTTRIVDADGNLAESEFGLDFGFTTTGTGDPGDAGVEMGVEFTVTNPSKQNTSAVVEVDPGNH